MRVIVTRPQPEADKWASAMQSAGIFALALPLIDIAYLPFTFHAAANYDAVMFVSRSAIEGFFQQVTLGSLKDARYMVTGLGSAESLMVHGVQRDCIDMPDARAGQFDSEALWRVVGQSNWQGKRVLMVRGANSLGEPEGRHWLADQLASAGAHVDFVASYQRRLPALTDLGRDVLQNPSASDLWLFSSSQAIAHLKLLVPSHNWSACQALATHPRIQIAAMGAGFGKVGIVRPVLSDVISSIKQDDESTTI